MIPIRILLIEDESIYSRLIKKLLSSYDVTVANSFNEALNQIEYNSYHLAILDLSLDKKIPSQGLELIPYLIEKNIYVVVMTGSNHKTLIDKAYDLGCHEYFIKGDEGEAIRIIMEKYLTSGKHHWFSDFFEKDFLTKNKVQIDLISRAFPILETEIPIFINGETGSGKTHLAKALHKYSKREGEFIDINCANLSDSLLESELFGHEKGSFTGATEKKIGILERANKGTVFLDEISSLSLSTQAKLLKAIEEKKFFPVGSNKSIQSNFRILSACYQDILVLINEGKFRKDLYHRIAGLPIYLLPLKERKEDIIPLIEHYCGFKKVSFSKEAKEFLLLYPWSGNTRELLTFTQLLLSSNSGKITKEIVVKILNSNLSFASASLVNSNIIEYAVEHGLQKLLEYFETEITKKIQSNPNTSTREVRRILKIGTRQYYRAMNRNVENHSSPRGNDELH